MKILKAAVAAGGLLIGLSGGASAEVFSLTLNGSQLTDGTGGVTRFIGSSTAISIGVTGSINLNDVTFTSGTLSTVNNYTTNAAGVRDTPQSGGTGTVNIASTPSSGVGSGSAPVVSAANHQATGSVLRYGSIVYQANIASLGGAQGWVSLFGNTSNVNYTIPSPGWQTNLTASQITIGQLTSGTDLEVGDSITFAYIDNNFNFIDTAQTIPGNNSGPGYSLAINIAPELNVKSAMGCMVLGLVMFPLLSDRRRKVAQA